MRGPRGCGQGVQGQAAATKSAFPPQNQQRNTETSRSLLGVVLETGNFKKSSIKVFHKSMFQNREPSQMDFGFAFGFLLSQPDTGTIVHAGVTPNGPLGSHRRPVTSPSQRVSNNPCALERAVSGTSHRKMARRDQLMARRLYNR